MALTSPDNIFSPDAGAPYALTEDLAALADSVQDALTARLDTPGTHEIYSYRWADSTARNAETGMRAGDYGYQVDTGFSYFYNGSAWVVSSTGVGAASLTLDAGVTASQNLVAKEGRVVTITVTATRSAGWSTDGEVGTLPSGFRPSATVYGAALTFGTGSVVGSQITSAGVISLIGPPSGHTVASLTISFVAAA